jgi:prepilin-type processing-associated H-X9-DG protein
MQLYQNKYGHFPPAYSVDKNGTPLLSWRVLILPFLEDQTLYDQFHLDEPWNSPHNLPLAKRMPGVYRCPAETNASNNATSNAMLVGPSAISMGPEGRKSADISDGVANTIMVAEKTGANIGWTEPRDLDAESMTFDLTDQSGTEISSRHSTTVNVLFADGSVKGLSKSSDADSVKSMTTIDGGEQIRAEDDAEIPD